MSQMGCDSQIQNMETRENRSMGVSLWSRIDGRWRSGRQTRSRNIDERKVEAKDPMDRVHQRANDRHNSRNQQEKLSSVYFTHAKHADHHVEKRNKTMGRYTQIRRHTAGIAGDFHVAPGPGVGTERPSGGPCTVAKSDRRGDWLKQWVIIHHFTALNTMFITDQKTKYILDTAWGRQTNGLHMDRQKKHETLQRFRGKRYDRSGKRSQVQCGTH